MDEVECKYKDKCKSHPTKCDNCEHNTGKRDYYKPDKKDYYKPHDRYWPEPHPYPCPYPQPKKKPEFWYRCEG